MQLTDKEKIEIDNFVKGFVSADIISAATVENGAIKLLTDKEQELALSLSNGYSGTLSKFVPASGAATRMMKGDTSTPKALVVFHDYGSYKRTAIEEHLVEGASYCRDKDNNVNIHFTISQEHAEKIMNFIDDILPNYTSKYHCNYNISYSVQEPSTDILAVDFDNNPVLLPDGKILKRPGGHGALLENLNKIESAYVLIKNIDNVVKENYLEDTIYWKKILLGRAIFLTNSSHSILLSLLECISDKSGIVNKEEFIKRLKIAIDFLSDEFSLQIPDTDSIKRLNDDHLLAQISSIVLQKLNRPIRVCGMVKNEGDVGGGPFVCRENDGTTSLQIVEGAQIDKTNLQSFNALKDSTHFNPVDIVCSKLDTLGKSYNLKNYADYTQGIITTKDYNGKKIKAQELPGLWNGSMAKWNTQFVEVPITTFNPVKTFDDLQKPMHK